LNGDGTLEHEDPVGYGQHILNLARAGVTEVDVIVYKHAKRKTKLERSYYFAVIVDILSSFSGHSKQEIHTALKMKFLRYQQEGIEYTRSTEELTTVECEEYHENIRRWAAMELGVYIPLPNEVECNGSNVV
jgi:hypothetical protein